MHCDAILHLITRQHVKDDKLEEALGAFPRQSFLLSTSAGLDPLVVLDPEQHSLGYLFFLYTLIRE
jgi:hypothetical protein